MLLKYLLVYLVLCLSLRICAGDIIYYLNDTEHDRLPKLFDLAPYESCLRNPGDTYCMVKLELYSDPPSEYLTFIQNYSNLYIKHFNYSRLERGICLKKQCQKFIESQSSGEIQDPGSVLERCMKDTIWNEYGLQSRIETYSCDRYGDKLEQDLYGWMYLFCVLVILALNIIGTLYDYNGQKLEKNQNNGYETFLLNFSIIRNWNALVASEVQADLRLQKLQGLHGLRSMIIIYFVYGHSFFIFNSFIENPHQYEKEYDEFVFRILFNTGNTVQILFTISGFLLVYKLLIDSEKRQLTWKSVPRTIFMRFWRLTPANAMFVMFWATWLPYLGSGPLWIPFVKKKVSQHCRSYWWSNLFYFSNYVTENVFCVIQNWHISVDMQLYVFGLCLFVLMQNRGSLLVRWLLILALVGSAAIGAHIWWEDLDPFLMPTPETMQTHSSRVLIVHMFTHNNLPGFVIGMLTGYAVYHWQKQQVDFSKHKWLLRTLARLMFPLMLYVFYTGSYFYLEDGRKSLLVRTLYGAALRPVISAITAFIIVGIVFQFKDYSLLEWKGWTLPSRLTYSISLLHTLFIALVFGTRTHLEYGTVFKHMNQSCGILTMSMLLAVPYTLLIESPFNRLLKQLLTSDPPRQKKEESGKEDWIAEKEKTT